MKLAIVGSRSITEFDSKAILCHFPQKVDAIISGGASGVDTLAENLAYEQKLPFIKIIPDYQKYGKKAPAIRNREIVRQADYILAIWDFKSRGTAHTIACCIEEGVPVRILSADDMSSEPDCSKNDIR